MASRLDPGPISVACITAREACRPGGLATHEQAVLVFYTQGRAVHTQRRSSFEAGEGDVSLIPAGEPHRVEAARGVVAWGISFCAACHAELAPLLAPFDRARAGASPIVRIPGDRHEHLARLCAELQRESSARREHGELVQKSLLGLILAEVQRAAPLAPPAEPQAPLVGEALRFIELHCLEAISLRDVAAAVRRSPAHVTTALRKATGKSAVEWIIQGRMAEARRRLARTDERVDIIAERVGYADATHFIRLFRREHGATPASWRASQRPRLG